MGAVDHFRPPRAEKFMSAQLKRTYFKTTRPRKDSRRDLKDTLDRIFSLFIRLRDGCCSLCGSTQNLECGHYIGRSNPAVRFDPLNAHCLCHNCNQLDNQNKAPYLNFMKRTYQPEALTELNSRAAQGKKFTDEWLKGQIKTFTDLVGILKDERSYQ